MAGSKYYDLEVFAQLLETLYGIWSDVDASLNFAIVGEDNLQRNIMGHLKRLIAMDESFI